jgi:hypothetical protein
MTANPRVTVDKFGVDVLKVLFVMQINGGADVVYVANVIVVT